MVFKSNGLRTMKVLDESCQRSVWINHKDEVWAWRYGDWRELRNSGLWSGMSMRSGYNMMSRRGPYEEIDSGGAGPGEGESKPVANARQVELTEELLELVDFAIWRAIGKHQSKVDEECTCGARNNMDGDVLFSHWVSVVSNAVQRALGVTDE